MTINNSVPSSTEKNQSYPPSSIFAEAVDNTIDANEMARLLIENLNSKLPLVTIIDDYSRYDDFIQTSDKIIQKVNSIVKLPARNIFLAMSNFTAALKFFSSRNQFATPIYGGAPAYIHAIAKRMREVQQHFICVIDWNFSPLLVRKRMGDVEFQNFNIIGFIDNLKKLNPDIEIIVWTSSPESAEEALSIYAQNKGLENDIQVISKEDHTYEELAGALSKALKRKIVNKDKES